MFRRLDGTDLLVTSGPAAKVFRVALDPFSFVSTIRWCGHRQELIVAATPSGNRVPDVSANDRGDLRLVRCDPRDGDRRQVYRGYAFWARLVQRSSTGLLCDRPQFARRLGRAYR